MNDHERFTKQMERTLEILLAEIRKLEVPLARRDSMLGLVRDLRQSAYQAGRAESALGCGKHD